MIVTQIMKKFRLTTAFMISMLMSMVTLSFAQEGHPLQGTWSGDRTLGEEKIRVLFIFNLQPDQSFDATLIENGSRIPVDVSVNPDNWSVAIDVDGQTRSGESLIYSVNGTFENLGAVFGRTIVGTWRAGRESGDFQLTMN